MHSPAKYQPSSPEEFIGSARTAARVIQGAIARARADGNAPLRFLINGPPGVGKSELVRWAIKEIGTSPWSLIKYNGTAVGIETMQQIESSVRLRDMYGYRVVQIEEADQISPKAQVRWLTVSDDLPAGNAVFFTSNCKVTDFEVRFQRRFQVLELTGPTVGETAGLLRRWLPADEAQGIADGSFSPLYGCCVGAALNDAQTALDTVTLRAA